MSFGSISREARHRLWRRDEPHRGKSIPAKAARSTPLKPLPNGDWMRSAIKQVAPGPSASRTMLRQCDDLVIKMAQGAARRRRPIRPQSR
jgi:glutamate synthase domain-containing protein 2